MESKKKGEWTLKYFRFEKLNQLRALKSCLSLIIRKISHLLKITAILINERHES